MTIITNHHPRPIIYGFELSESERSEFDYLENIEDASFFRYRGQLYDLGEFVRIVPAGSKGSAFAHYDHTGELSGWHGIATDSYFSAVVVRYSEDDEAVVVGLALS